MFVTILVCALDNTCDFERGLCGWSNTQSPSVDWLDWDLTNVQAEKFYSSPPYDHTLYTDEGDFSRFRWACQYCIHYANYNLVTLKQHTTVSLFLALGHFLFLPNSQRDTATQNAWLLSPHLAPTKGTCLSFWLYQPTMCMSYFYYYNIHLQFCVSKLNLI